MVHEIVKHIVIDIDCNFIKLDVQISKEGWKRNPTLVKGMSPGLSKATKWRFASASAFNNTIYIWKEELSFVCAFNLYCLVLLVHFLTD